jgi:hypothetical protein
MSKDCPSCLHVRWSRTWGDWACHHPSLIPDSCIGTRVIWEVGPGVNQYRTAPKCGESRINYEARA